MIKSPLKNYLFWLKLAGAAILIVLGVWIIFDKTLGAKLVVGFTGALIIIFAVVRVVPLIRTLKAKQSKYLCTLEVLINLLIGAFVFYGAVAINKDSNGFVAKFVSNYYIFLLGAVFYLRGLFYFTCCIMYKEETDKAKFWSHILVLTLGAVCFTLKDFEISTLSIIIAIIALASSAYLIFDGGKNYNNYRRQIKTAREDKEVNKKASIEVPGVDETKEIIIETPVNPTIQDPIQDEERPYIS